MVRNNHYVPQFYLKSWCCDSSGKKIWVYDRLVPHQNYDVWKKKSIESVACMRDLYTFQRDSVETDEIEIEINALYESPFAQEVLPKIVSRECLSERDWDILCDYVLLQFLRTPKRYNSILSAMDQIIPRHLRDGVEEAAYNISNGIVHSENLPQLPFSEHIPLDFVIDNDVIRGRAISGKGAYLFTLRHLMQNSFELRKILRGLNWQFIYPPKEISFPTCDDPVMCVCVKDDLSFYFVDVFGVPNGEVIFPISPDICLYAQIGNNEEGLRFRSDTDFWIFCAFICRFIVEHSYRYVYSSSTLDYVPRFCPRTEDLHAWQAAKEAWEGNHEKQMFLEDIYRQVIQGKQGDLI